MNDPLFGHSNPIHDTYSQFTDIFNSPPQSVQSNAFNDDSTEQFLSNNPENFYNSINSNDDDNMMKNLQEWNQWNLAVEPMALENVLLSTNSNNTESDFISTQDVEDGVLGMEEDGLNLSNQFNVQHVSVKYKNISIDIGPNAYSLESFSCV